MSKGYRRKTLAEAVAIQVLAQLEKGESVLIFDVADPGDSEEQGGMSGERESLSKELVALGSLVDRAARARRYGSFSDRNPLLGRMVRCPHCGRRRRENSAFPCCNAKLSERTRAGTPRAKVVRTEPKPRAAERRQGPRVSPGARHAPMAMMRRLHQLVKEFDADPAGTQKRLELDPGRKPRPPIKAEHRAGFAAKFIEVSERREAKAKRDVRKKSRKTNRRKG